MYNKFQKTFTQLMNVAAGCILAFAGVRCDSLLPDDYDEKEYSAQGVDAKAASLLSRNFVDSTGTTIIDSASCIIVNPRTMQSIVDSVTRLKLTQDSITEDQVIVSKFNALIDSMNAQNLRRDTVMLITKRPTNDLVTFAKLEVTAGQKKDVYIYTSLHYTKENITEGIIIQLVKQNSSRVSYSDDMPVESISAHTQVIISAGNEYLVPTIKTRYKVHLEEGVYLVRFAVGNPGAVGIYKVLILSL